MLASQKGKSVETERRRNHGKELQERQTFKEGNENQYTVAAKSMTKKRFTKEMLWHK